MSRCLIVANQTLDSEELAATVKKRIDAGGHTFYVVVPATTLNDQVGRTGSYATAGPSPGAHAYAVAEQRLHQALNHIRQLGAEADGEVGDPDAFEAVRIAVSRFGADEVIVSTLPPALSRWLRRDLPGRINRAFHLPVTQVGEAAAHR